MTATTDELNLILGDLSAKHSKRAIDLAAMLQHIEWAAAENHQAGLKATLASVTHAYMVTHCITTEELLAANDAIRQARITIALLDAIPT